MSDLVAVGKPAVAKSQTKPRAAALFREEAVDAQRNQWLGTILLEPRISHKLATRAAIIMACALLIFGSFTRKERVSGWLVPAKGVARVLPPQQAIVQMLAVAEGSIVRKGAVLAVLTADLQTAAVGAAGEAVVRQLNKRRESLTLLRGTQADLFDNQTAELSRRIEALTHEQASLETEIALQTRRLELARQAVERARILREKRYVTKANLSAAEGEQIDQAARVQVLDRTLSERRREADAARSVLRELPFQREAKLGEIERDTATIDQQIAEAEARRQFTLVAPQDGIVTAIQTDVGGTAQAGVPLLSVIPGKSGLQAQLFAPSRAIGFIRKGDEVRLRYQPFPYQSFGFYSGRVSSVSLTALSPAELPQQLAGLSDFYGANAPVYRITVDLDRQDVTAYGQRLPLQAGMQLEADVLVERHSLIEWILYPLLAKTGAWSG